MDDQHIRNMIKKCEGKMVAGVPAMHIIEMANELLELRAEADRWRPKCHNYRKAIRGLERYVAKTKMAERPATTPERDSVFHLPVQS